MVAFRLWPLLGKREELPTSCPLLPTVIFTLGIWPSALAKFSFLPFSCNEGSFCNL